MKHQIFIAIATIAMHFMACKSEPQYLPSETGKFPVTFPRQTDTVFNAEYVAEIQSVQNIEIRSRIRSYIANIHVDEGQTVRKGQLLFSLSSQGIKEELHKAQATMQASIAAQKPLEIDIRNTRLMVEKNVISNTELEMKLAELEVLKAQLEEAKADIAAAQNTLSYTEIRAPFDGIIGRIPNKTGSLIEEGALLTTLSNNDAVYAYFNISEKDYLLLTKEKALLQKPGLTLLLADNTHHQHKGTIETIDGQFDPNTGNIALRARFPNPNGILRHGASGKVLIPKNLKNALIIPQKSTFDIQDKTFVYIVEQNGVVSQRAIVPGLRLPQMYVVESGLSVTDRILYEGIQYVKDGDQIMVNEAVPMQAIAQ
jgi:membrane fusion protein (multidrug efflux system)